MAAGTTSPPPPVTPTNGVDPLFASLTAAEIAPYCPGLARHGGRVSARSALHEMSTVLGYDAPTYSREEGAKGAWIVEIRRPRGPPLRYASDPSSGGVDAVRKGPASMSSSSHETTKGTRRAEREGGEAAAARAVRDPAFRAEVERALAKTPLPFAEYFDEHFEPSGGSILEASDEAYAELRRRVEQHRLVLSDDPGLPAVGVDAEGLSSRNAYGSPPRLVQVAARDLVVLEVVAPGQRDVSRALRELLDDRRVVKLLCDGDAIDAASLGLRYDHTRPDLVNLEDLIVEDAASTEAPHGGGAPLMNKTRRRHLGLSRICDLAGLAPPSTRFVKDDNGWRFFESRRGRRIASLDDVPAKAQRYAAMDAWFTLLAGEALLLLRGRARPPSCENNNNAEEEDVESEQPSCDARCEEASHPLQMPRRRRDAVLDHDADPGEASTTPKRRLDDEDLDDTESGRRRCEQPPQGSTATAEAKVRRRRDDLWPPRPPTRERVIVGILNAPSP